MSAVVTTKECITVHCDSLRDFTEIPQPAAPDGVMASRIESTFRTEWTWTPTFEAAVDIVRAGWPAGAKAASEALPIAGIVGRDTIELVPDVAGGSVDIGAYLSGAPDCMIDCRLTPDPRGGRVLAVDFNGAVNAGWGADELAAAAAAISEAVDAVEQSGVRVEVTVSWGLSKPFRSLRKDMVVRVAVKAAEDPLDIGRIAGALHPSSFRRLMFAWTEATAEPNGGYGGQLAFPESFNIQKSLRGPKDQWPKIVTDWLTKKVNAEQ